MRGSEAVKSFQGPRMPCLITPLIRSHSCSPSFYHQLHLFHYCLFPRQPSSITICFLCYGNAVKEEIFPQTISLKLPASFRISCPSYSLPVNEVKEFSGPNSPQLLLTYSIVRNYLFSNPSKN